MIENKEKVVERFLKYVSFDTQANPKSDTVPSTAKQLDLGRYLVDEMTHLGLEDVKMSEFGVVTGKLKSNVSHSVSPIGFIAHMDTSFDMSDTDTKPKRMIYQGGDVELNSDGPIVLSAKEFPEILPYVGQEIIFTDGTTLLGADDKAGITAILSAAEYLIFHPEIPHGDICFGFTPDEEIGRGVDHFDVADFGAEFAYTIDGGPIGAIEYENFNAANVTFTIQGRNVHPGTSKNKMVNSLSIAAEIQRLLPEAQKPEHTEEYEGFFHVNSIQGNVEQTKMQMLIRDHDRTKFEAKKAYLREVESFLNKKYGAEIVSADIKDMYFNMREKIEPVIHIVELAKEAMVNLGITPKTTPVRGGTDGARLSFMGLPCPNIFTGGHNFHGKFEFLPVESLVKSAAVVVEIARLATKK